MNGPGSVPRSCSSRYPTSSTFRPGRRQKNPPCPRKTEWGIVSLRLSSRGRPVAGRAGFVNSANMRVVDGGNVGYAPRLLACMEQAGEAARLDGSPEIGPHHLLLGLMEDGVAAVILERFGVRAAAIRETSVSLFG